MVKMEKINESISAVDWQIKMNIVIDSNFTEMQLIIELADFVNSLSDEEKESSAHLIARNEFLQNIPERFNHLIK